MTYSQWESPTVPIYLQFYVFNLTNPAEVSIGTGKPYLVELGPYTYRETRRKVNITWNDNGTVSYKQIRSWFFDEGMSKGKEDDLIISANLPLITVFEALRYESAAVREVFAAATGGIEKDIFIPLTVNQFVWGYEDELLKLGRRFFPDWFYTDILGIYAGKNNTDDGTYSVFTGVDDISQLGIIDTYNGTRRLPFWSTDAANMINGSDGTLCPPSVQQDQRLYVFSTDIYRSLSGTYDAELENEFGITLWRFAGTKEEMESGRHNPDNIGFCTPPGNCGFDDGLLNLTEPATFDYFHLPVVASMPHFLYADQKYINAVYGMRPVEDLHRTEAYVEPLTGIVMRIYKRLQINVHLRTVPDIWELGHLDDIVMPLVWVNESATIDEANADTFKTTMLPMKIIAVLQYILIGLGGVAIITAIVIIVRQRKAAIGEKTPLLVNSTRASGACEQHPADPAPADFDSQ